LLLLNELIEAGIEVHQGWALDGIEEKAHSVLAGFTNGQSYEGSFSVGCDGIKATSRAIVLQLKSGTSPQLLSLVIL